MFNKTKKLAKKEAKVQEDLSKERNDRCLPAAREILAITAKGRIDDVDPSGMFEDYSPLVREVMEVLKKHEIKLGEVKFVFRLVMISPTLLEDTVNQSLDKHLSTTEAMFWGKPGDEVTIKDLDKRLKEGKEGK